MTGCEVDVAARTDDLLGEGPVWLAQSGQLAWVDIGRAAWHRLTLATGHVTSVTFDSPLCGFAPARDGRFIGAFADGIAAFDASGRRSVLHRPERDKPGNRFNDAGTDPRGRFVAGTMNQSADAPSAAFYVLGTDGTLSVLRDAVTIANTVAFSPDGRRMYMADTAAGELAAFHYDPDAGRLGPRDPYFDPPADLPGAPDGSAVDADGCLWNARWDGGCLLRLTPSGRVDRTLELPVTKPTSCAFADGRLFITTATWDFGPEDHAREPLAGALLAADVGIDGVSKAVYGGPLE